MQREIKLSLDGLENNEEDKLEIIPEKEVAKRKVNLSPEEAKQVEEFAKQIDISDSNLVLQYGAGAQKKIANFSEKTLDSVKTKDLGEIGELLGNVVTELKNFEIDEEDNKLVSFFKKQVNKANSIRVKYDNAEKNVDNIIKALENHQMILMKDIATLDQMYDLNESYYKELSMYILAGKKKLEEARELELPKLQKEAQNSNLPIDAQKANDYVNLINRFEKKLHDLDLTRMVSIQMAPQIRMVQSSNTIMVEKIQSIMVNTIPLWKSQMVIAMGANHSKEAAKTTKEVTDLTNKLLRKNAQSLNQQSIETANLSERGIVDIETIKYTNDQLISALTEVRKIQEQGHERRIQAEEELAKIEENLKSSLREIAKK
ncbi:MULTISPECIES: toxic anion resistance protein [Peptoniphilus]|uniref:toxic anion resistance protein n=1 Tax=Peptoniphilus TaxID=162289 RepID=UPI0001DC9EF1|nr:toxic anion resistance protein [Peptoniphilus sp. oral taxon 836]EFK38209.1 toxic anion resistance protein TelA [Peptoniphilus sp. oral taxon 836 str. F0141]